MGVNANASSSFNVKQINFHIADPGGAAADTTDFEVWMPPSGGCKVHAVRIFAQTAFAGCDSGGTNKVVLSLKQGSSVIATADVTTNLAAGASQALTVSGTLAEVAGGTVVKWDAQAGGTANAPSYNVQIDWSQDGIKV